MEPYSEPKMKSGTNTFQLPENKINSLTGNLYDLNDILCKIMEVIEVSTLEGVGCTTPCSPDDKIGQLISFTSTMKEKGRIIINSITKL